MQRLLTATALAAALTLGACASSPEPIPHELQTARATVQRAEADPAVLADAPLQLKQATEALAKANSLNAEGESLAEIASASYVAQRHAEAALEVARAKRNQEAMRAAALERERTRADIEAAQARDAEQRAALAQSRAAVASLQAQAQGDRAANAEARAALAQATAAEARQQAADLQAQLAQVKAEQTERGMLVTLGDVLFEFNKAEVKASARSELAKVAQFMQQHPDRQILIEGYTDNVGGSGYNLDLSRARAVAVGRELEALGVPASRITTAGYGKDFPVASNANASDRAMNRRVEVYISNDGQPVQPRQG